MRFRLGKLCGLALLVCVGCRTAPQLDTTAAVMQASTATRLPPVEVVFPIDTPVSPIDVTEHFATRLVAHAEDVLPCHPGTLFEGPTQVDDLVGYALANNPTIGAVRAKAESLISRVPQAQSLSDPMLATTAFLKSIETAAGPQEVMVSLSQKFPWFGKRALRGDVAFYHAQVAYAELSSAELQVSEQVKLAYYQLYFIDEAIQVNRTLEKPLQDVIAITRTKYETNARRTGLESVLQAEVALSKLQTTIVELEQARLKAIARLAESLHLPRGSRLDIQPEATQSTLPRDVDNLVGLLEQCQPQLLARERGILRDESRIALAERDYFPDVNLGFIWNSIGSTGLSAVANGDDAYSLMVGVNVPIYRSRLNGAVREAEFKTTQSAEQYDATWDALRKQVQTLHADAVEHDRLLKILDKDILPKADQTLELSIEAYRLDRIGFQQLIDNYRDLLRFRIEYYMHKSRREQAIASLERVVGCVLADVLPELEEVPVGEVVPNQ